MKVEAIVYHSSAGTTERYARRLSELTGLPAVPFREARKSLQGKPVLFMSWLCSGVLLYFEKAAARMDVRGLCAVGIGKADMALSDLQRHHTLNSRPVFFLPGAFQMKRLGFLQRRTMKDLELSIARAIRAGDRVTSADLELYKMLRDGTDHYDETQLEPVLRWLRPEE